MKVRQWDEYWQHIVDRKELLYRTWRMAAPKVDSRIILNYARVCAAIDVHLPDDGRSMRFFNMMTAKASETQEKNELAKMIKYLPWFLKVKKTAIPWSINKKKKCLNVHADFLITQYAENFKIPAQSAKELIRYGKQSNILVLNHPDAPHVVAIKNPLTKASSSNRCFMFDATNDIVVVEEVIEQLSVTGKTDEDNYQSNPDDLFMPPE